MTEKEWEDWYSDYIAPIDNWVEPTFIPCEKTQSKTKQ
jgi:hypothetical protein